jgi:hypothetical protein
MNKIILLIALALLNTNISASEKPGFFSKNFLKEGLAHTENNIVVTGGTLYYLVTLMDYFDDSSTPADPTIPKTISMYPAATIGYEKKYSDDSALLFNFTLGSNMKLHKENYRIFELFQNLIIRSQLLWTFNIFQKENFFIDYGLILHVNLIVDDLFTAGLNPFYLSFNWNITNNMTVICTLIPEPVGLGIFASHDKMIYNSLNDSFEIGVKIKM